ncbi:unnamed protein product [Ranitomeya imitator]|uniref:Reverse transcriptase RNase H-like domain-containing protein n=1 Tax=Ranitomeya imitator TaxID=111125 RepID=A0ABN9LAR7_9NEOB|nr:unnamed protein product [Ranitomeya imitator]
MDPVKVQAIHDWIQPTSVKSLQKFLGFANFYRRFIANFSSVVKPLTDLTKKGADVTNWSSEAVEAFQELKRRFTSAPVLRQLDVSLPFQVEVDASEIGAGAVLSQRNSDGSLMKPCAFFSRKFSPAERNYDVGNRELLAMKWAFEEWRHWLEGAKHRIVVLTDHKNLIYLESAKRLNPRQARWSLFFSRFDFVVSYLPGSKNVKADALSRSFLPDSPGVLELVGILKEGVILSVISPDLRRVLQEFQADRPDRCPVGKLFVPDRWTMDDVKKRWRSVTDRLVKAQRTESGSSPSKRRVPFAEQLQFILTSRNLRRTGNAVILYVCCCYSTLLYGGQFVLCCGCSVGVYCCCSCLWRCIKLCWWWFKAHWDGGEFCPSCDIGKGSTQEGQKKETLTSVIEALTSRTLNIIDNSSTQDEMDKYGSVIASCLRSMPWDRQSLCMTAVHAVLMAAAVPSAIPHLITQVCLHNHQQLLHSVFSMQQHTGPTLQKPTLPATHQ